MLAKQTILQQIEARYGHVLAYDNLYCVWTAQGVMDLRDIGTSLRLNHGDVQAALQEAADAEHKRFKAERKAAQTLKDEKASSTFDVDL